MDYASVTSIIHCRSCCNFLISWCHQQIPDQATVADEVIVPWRISGFVAMPQSPSESGITSRSFTVKSIVDIIGGHSSPWNDKSLVVNFIETLKSSNSGIIKVLQLISQSMCLRLYVKGLYNYSPCSNGVSPELYSLVLIYASAGCYSTSSSSAKSPIQPHFGDGGQIFQMQIRPPEPAHQNRQKATNVIVCRRASLIKTEFHLARHDTRDM